jgi:hypothetical protein
MILLYLFALLTQPTDRILCDLWTRALTQEAFVQACPALPITDLRVDVIDAEDLTLLCQRPAALLPRISEECGLDKSLDHYVFRIVKPAQQDLLCIVESQYAETPAPEEIAAQCPGVVNYIIQPAGTRQIEPAQPACPMQSIPTGAGLYEQPAQVADLATAESLPLLAGELIWYGYVKPDCAGMSGVTSNHLPTPCGLAAARQAVIDWQNQFDIAIYNAALTHNIPARLLKRIILVESQFWIFYSAGKDGEIGVMQVTDNGLDTLLRFDPWLDPTYASKSDDARAWSRAAVRPYFETENVQTIQNNMTYYARLLAAFHCRTLTVNPALTGADAWRTTVINYNGAPEYLLKIER